MKNTETDLSKIETILYTYNHKTRHDTTGQTPAHIFLYAGQPTLNTQELKKTKIDKLNKGGKTTISTQDTEKFHYKKGKLDNPYKPTKKNKQTLTITKLLKETELCITTTHNSKNER